MPILSEATNVIRLTPRDLPVGIKKVIKRIDIDLPDRYYAWADELALLNEELIARVTGWTAPQTADELFALGWNALPYVYWCHRRIGKNCFWIYPWDCGWSIEVYRSVQQMAYVLTIDTMPILCSNPLNAIQLAEASYPVSKRPLRWLPRDVDNCCEPKELGPPRLADNRYNGLGRSAGRPPPPPPFAATAHCPIAAMAVPPSGKVPAPSKLGTSGKKVRSR
jgi:hypothetical protein